MRLFHSALALSGLIIACSDSVQVLTPPDGSMPDASVPDSGMMDATTMPDGNMGMDAMMEAATDAPDEAETGPMCDADAGQTACGNTCVTLDTDQKNCGFCGHDCLGAACTKGFCAPETLITGVNNPDGIVVDGNNIYVIELGNGDFMSANGRIFQCPTSGCANNKPGVMTDLQNDPVAIAVDPNNVYWATAGDLGQVNGTIMTCPIAGCGKNNANRRKLATVMFPHGLAVDLANVYFDDFKTFQGNGDIESCAIAGCNQTPTVLTSALRPWVIAVDGTDAFYATNTQIPHMNKNPLNMMQSPTMLDSSAGARYAAIALDANNVYYTDDNNGTVRSCIKGNCNNNSVLIASNLNTPTGVAVGAQGVYWSDSGTGNSDGEIAYCQGGQQCLNSTQILLASGLDGPSAVAIDSKYIYWTNAGASDNTGSVMRVAR